MGVMNLEPSESLMNQFIEDHNLVNLVNNKTCYKCIDLILTNRKLFFQHTDTLETGLSDCHLLVYTMFKTSICKQLLYNYSCCHNGKHTYLLRQK